MEIHENKITPYYHENKFTKKHGMTKEVQSERRKMTLVKSYMTINNQGKHTNFSSKKNSQKLEAIHLTMQCLELLKRGSSFINTNLE